MNKIIIYTDGACSGNQSKNNIGGWGVYLQYKDNIKEIYGGKINTTNNQMEMQAVIEALKALKRKDIPIRLHTDSAYVANCFKQKWYVKWRKNGWKNSKKQEVENKDLWLTMLELYESFDDIEIIKVKGHSGVELNERADKLANIGMDKVRCSDI